MLTYSQIITTLARIRFREGWYFDSSCLQRSERLSERAGPVFADFPFLRLRFWRADAETGVEGWGYGALYPLWECETARDVVQTAFKAVRDVLEHEAREDFRVDGVAVLAPHGLSLDDLLAQGKEQAVAG